jgi:hypothetical protein
MTASVVMESGVLEAELAAGRIACEACGGRLSRWGFAREREVRMLDGVRSLRPRRARCGPCETTHVLLPAWSVPRRRDGAEVIGQALVLKAQGAGHRTIARRLDRAPGTVRGWLRAGARRADALRLCGVKWTVALSEELGRPWLADSPLQYALDALGGAAIGWRLRFGVSATPWELIVAFTGGLLSGRPCDPPGY